MNTSTYNPEERVNREYGRKLYDHYDRPKYWDSTTLRTLEGTVMVGGLSALGPGLHSLGIPKYSIMEYEKAIVSDKFIVIAHGRPDDIAKAKSILETPDPGVNPPIIRTELSHRA